MAGAFPVDLWSFLLLPPIRFSSVVAGEIGKSGLSQCSAPHLRFSSCSGGFLAEDIDPTRSVVRDTNLVEAAPELLAALKKMDELVESLWKSVPWNQTFDLDVKLLNEAPLQAKAAIAKAEGRELLV